MWRYTTCACFFTFHLTSLPFMKRSSHLSHYKWGREVATSIHFFRIFVDIIFNHMCDINDRKHYIFYQINLCKFRTSNAFRILSACILNDSKLWYYTRLPVLWELRLWGTYMSDWFIQELHRSDVMVSRLKIQGRLKF